MSSQGWIKLHRKLQECSIWDSEKPFDDRSAWIDLLLLANHRDKDFLFGRENITIQKGQYMTSVRKLSERWTWSKDKTLRYLRMLEDLKMITKESDNKRTLLTIVNYEVYQGSCDTDEDTYKDTRKDTNKDTSKDTNKPQTRIKEYKELKNEKNVKNNNTYCSEPSQASEPAVVELILNDNSLYPITQTMIDEWSAIYPGVDVTNECRKMLGWCKGNPNKRKTIKGINRFINSWLSKEQDSGSSNREPKPSAYMDAIKNRVNIVDSWI